VRKFPIVLIVDDSQAFRVFFRDTLKRTVKWARIVEAKDGYEGLQMYLKYKPDVILLDLEMPKMDGLTFIEEMAKKGVLIPIIIVSSFSQDGSKVVLDALENGAVDFVTMDQGHGKDKDLQDTLISKIKIASNSDPIQLIKNKIYSLKPNHRKMPV